MDIGGETKRRLKGLIMMIILEVEIKVMEMVL